jgi:hypothetical protein
MAKQVVVVASGETERRALPHLVRHLKAEGITLRDVRVPPGYKQLDVEMAEKLIKSVWYEQLAAPPDKFVILVDADGKVPAQVLGPFQEQLAGRLGKTLRVPLQFAYAQWHLEAWYFADAAALRDQLGGSLGSVDASAPDDIQSPKLHLKHLLGERAYTAVVSEEIAKAMDGQKIAHRSPSFQGFLEALRNGPPAPAV